MGQGFEEEEDYDEGAKFERRSTFELNLRLLGWSAGRSSLVLRGFPLLDASPPTIDAMESLVEQLDAQTSDWGFKDPRTCLTYDLWAGVMPTHRIVGVYRHPYQVCRHYGAVNPVRTWKVLHAWMIHNLTVLQACRRAGPDSAILLSYEQLMQEDSELDRLGEFIERSVADVRRPGKYRNRRHGGVGRTMVERLIIAAHGCRSLELQEALDNLRSCHATWS